MRKTTIAKPEKNMIRNPADEPISREDFPFSETMKKLGFKEEDYILCRLENGTPAWKPRYDRRKEILKKLDEIFANAPKSEFDDMTEDEVMQIAIEEIRASREERDKKLVQQKS